MSKQVTAVRQLIKSRLDRREQLQREFLSKETGSAEERVVWGRIIQIDEDIKEAEKLLPVERKDIIDSHCIGQQDSSDSISWLESRAENYFNETFEQ